MRSSSSLERFSPWACLFVAASVISLLRAPLAARLERVRRDSDVLLLPPPDQVLVGSLGYRAALADVLFAHVLVWYGEHLRVKLRFQYIAQYLEIITSLDPTFREPYYYGDTLITLQTQAPLREDYEAARRLLEKGMKNRPDDTELWLIAGQFLAYVAPPYLGDDKLAARYRQQGARVLAHACELVGDNENLPYHCITAAGLFDKAGDRESMIRFLERMVAVIDDPEIQNMALAYLDRYRSEQEKERLMLRHQALEAKWKSDLPAIGRTKSLVIGPGFDEASCSGIDSTCTTSWRAFGEALNIGEARERP